VFPWTGTGITLVRQALALLKLAKSTSNAKVAANLISLAANLKE
jgi:hypothetical protein